MKIGFCAPIESYQRVCEAGFDYIELPLSPVGQMTENEFITFEKHLTEGRVVCPTANMFLPANIRVAGDDADLDRAEDYCEKALARAARMGCEVVVLGSGRSRNVSPDYDKAKASEQFARFGKKAGTIAAKHGITVVLEPLNRIESNLLNSVQQGYKMALNIDHPNVKLLADYYHMQVEGEPLDHLFEARNYIYHVHTAGLLGRALPRAANRREQSAFLEALSGIGYNKRLSIEPASGTYTVEEMRQSLNLFRSLIG